MTISVTRLQINLLQAVDPNQGLSFSLPVIGRLTALTSHGPRYKMNRMSRTDRMSQLRSKHATTQPSGVQLSVEVHITSDMAGHLPGIPSLPRSPRSPNGYAHSRSIHGDDQSKDHSDYSHYSAWADGKGDEEISMQSMRYKNPSSQSLHVYNQPDRPNPPINPTRPRSLRYNDER